MKKIIILLLGVLAILPAIAQNSFEYEYEGQTLTYWILDNDAKTCAVSASKDISGEIKIPSDARDANNAKYSVTEISANGFYRCESITSFTIPSSVTSIGNNAFYGCTGLTSVTIPEGVTSIGNWAFFGCTGLTAVAIAEGVTSIGDGVFKNCRGLTSVSFADGVTSIGSDAFYNCYGLIKADFASIEQLCAISFGNYASNPLYYAHHLYIGNSEIKELVIPAGVTTIKNGTFRGCTGLTSVVIPEGVASIGDYAFYGCTGLTSVAIAEGVTSIESYTFNGCIGLTSVVIPEGVASIGDFAFSGCTGLTSVSFAEGVNSIGYNAFNDCYGLTKADFVSIEQLCAISFGNYASNPLYYAHHLYIGNSEITELVIPKEVTSIGSYSFNGCTGLTSVAIPEGVTSIGDYAFYTCDGLTSVAIPEGVASIGYAAFTNCIGLTSVSIPASVTEIGENVWAYCDAIQEVLSYSTTPIRADRNIFDTTIYRNATLYIPIGSIDNYEVTEPWKYFSDIREALSDNSGIEITGNPNKMPCEVYDLNGLEVYDLNGLKVGESLENIEKGIYIIHQGSNTKKIIVK